MCVQQSVKAVLFSGTTVLWAKTEHGFDLSVEKNNLPRLRVAVSSTESLATLQAPPGEISLPSCDRITFRMDNCQT